MALTDPATIPAMVCQRAAAHGGQTILRRKHRGIWQPTTWAELATAMRAAGMGLKAVGCAPGEVTCVLSETRPEWVYADLGALGAGLACAGIDPAAAAAPVAERLRGVECRVLFVEGEEQLDTALQVAGECPALERIVIFEMKGLRDLADVRCESFAGFCARGIALDQANPGMWEAGIAALTGDRPAVLVQTMMLTHGDILAIAAARSGVRAGDERLAFLPMGDAAERLHGCYQALFAGIVSNYAESPETVLENLQEVQPTLLCAAPDTWERLHARITLAVAEATPLQRLAYRLAIGIGNRAATAGRPTRALRWLADQLVLRNVRRDIGLDRLRLAMVGSRPVAPEVMRWYRALGIDLRPVDECAGGGADC